jgi:hypothetical protein
MVRARLAPGGHRDANGGQLLFLEAEKQNDLPRLAFDIN